jgi:phage/plasmid-like protein (TIGR03299 family)
VGHNIDETSGKPAFAYVGKEAWHGLGEELPEGRPIQDWLKAARLEWKLERMPVQYFVKGQPRTMPERFVLARSDSGEALSIVSGGYNILQPKEVLEFYQDLVEEHGFALETAGALDGGRKFWALARTRRFDYIHQKCDDGVAGYVLLASSCDKSLATTAAFTSIRVVCQNTLSFALDDIQAVKRPHIKIPHHRRFVPELVKKDLGLFDKAWSDFLYKVRRMADCPMRAEDASKFFKKLLLQRGKNTLSVKAEREHQTIESLFKSAPGQDLATAQNTLWGAVNAVTYYVDHARSGSTAERLDDSWFGAGSALKDKAWASAISLIPN